MGFRNWYRGQAEQLERGVDALGDELSDIGGTLKAEFGKAVDFTVDKAAEGYQAVKQGYSAVSGVFEEQRGDFITRLEEASPRLAAALQSVNRGMRVVEHGIQDGVVTIGAGMAGIVGDTVLNNGWEFVTGEKLFNGSVRDWTDRHLNRAIDGVQEVASLGAIQPISDLSETEQDVSDVFSVATQLAMPAMTVASGVTKGRQLVDATRTAHMASPHRGWLRNFFDDAVQFSQHPIRSTKEALSFTSSSNNSLNLGIQLGEETLQVAGMTR